MRSDSALGVSSHLAGLQSLRGLAAIIVLFHHPLFYFATTPDFRFWSEALFNAHAAVMLFFVLSGFVLVRSINRQQPTFATTAVFYARRVFRIAPAMWVAVLAAAVFFVSLRYLPAGPLTSAWYTTTGKIAETGPADFVKALFGLPSKGVLPPLWSIRVEIGASVVIPLFAVLAARGRLTIGFAAVALCLGTILVSTWYVGAASYIALFIIGAALVPFFDGFRGCSWGRSLALIALSVLLFFRLVNPLWRFETDFSAVLPGIIEGCAAAVLIGVVGARPQALSVLTRPSLVYLGDISYSVYLLHFVFMEANAKIMGMAMPGVISNHPNFSAMTLAALTLLLTIPAGMLCYRFVEQPGIELGTMLLSALRQARISPRQT